MRSISKMRGFTLIELLVVIAIIGLLSSVVLASLSGARESARDVRRKQDLEQIQTAMELYYNDQGYYNNRDGTCDPQGEFNEADNGEDYSMAGCLVEGGYTQGEIVDPQGAKSSEDATVPYYIDSHPQEYTIWTHLENPTDQDQQTLDSCISDQYDYLEFTNYCVSSN